jgi:hypothetical protein
MIYDIADLRIDIRNEYPYTTRFCAAYLSNDQQSAADIVATVNAEDIEEEKKHSPNFPDGYIENICLYRNICVQMPQFNRMLLHAAVLEYDGCAYAFLGRSGTGKSTHTGLWLQAFDGVKIVNGDKPILQVGEDGVIAYGTPWMGKEGRGCNTKAPLKGLCFLEQAKENSIRRLSPAEVASKLFLQILMPSEESAAAKTLELADRLISAVPAWLLKCDISEAAVQCSFEEMTKQSFAKAKGRKL